MLARLFDNAVDSSASQLEDKQPPIYGILTLAEKLDAAINKIEDKSKTPLILTNITNTDNINLTISKYYSSNLPLHSTLFIRRLLESLIVEIVFS